MLSAIYRTGVFLSLAGALLSSVASAEVVLASNFNGVDKTDSSAPYTATSITWDTVAGLVTPAGTLTFIEPDGGNGGNVDGFHDVTANEIDVDYNLATEGPWSTSIGLVLSGAESIDLTSLDFNWRVTNNSGASSSGTSKNDTWTAEITGSVSGSLGTASVGPTTPGSPTQARSIDLSSYTLTKTETWTLTLRLDGTGWGHNASLQDLSLSGTITPLMTGLTFSIR